MIKVKVYKRKGERLTFSGRFDILNKPSGESDKARMSRAYCSVEKETKKVLDKALTVW